MLMILFMGIGQMWGDETINLFYGTSKAVDGNNVNHEDFVFSRKATIKTGQTSQTIGTEFFTHYLELNGYGANSLSGADTSKVIYYHTKTTSTKITVYIKNGNSSKKKYYIDHLFEGETTVADGRKYEKELAKSSENGNEKKEYTVTNTEGKNVVIGVMPGQNGYIYQIVVEENGTPLLKAGEDGYSLTFPGRFSSLSALYPVQIDEKMTISPSSGLKCLNGPLKIKQETSYVKFELSKKMAVRVTPKNNRKFIFCAAATPTTEEKATANLKGGTADVAVNTALAAGTWYLESENTSELQLSGISFFVPKVSYNANGGEGTMEATEWTVDENGFTAPEGKKFDKWTTSQDGTGTDVVKAVGAEVTENTTLYAQWKADVEEYTVTYKDGETTLKSVNVNVNSAPEAYTPTKALCSFAGWKDGEGNDVTLSSLATSAAKNDVVTLYAQWTKLYAQSVDFTSYLLETERLNKSLATVIEENGLNYTCGGTFSSSEWGKTSGEEAAFQGYKFKDKNVYIEFRVEANKHVTLLFGNYGATGKIKVGDADAVDCTLTDSKYEINTDAEVIIRFTTNTGSGSTVTLKKITISSLYTASYVDETGDGEAGGDDENVSEVTLPTPSVTTVTKAEKKYTFTGWTPSTGVKVGGVDKGTSDVLTAGTVVTLLDNTTFTAQWQEVTDLDVKFFQGYGEPNAQIGETQSISTGNFAVAPADPTRTGYKFLGWSTDGTEANIKDVAAYAIIGTTNFTAVWKQVWTVTFDGAGSVEVENGETVASPNSPVLAGKVFQGWYNEEVKYDFSSVVASNLALTSKWADADANHYVYAYNDDFHFDGVVYKTPEGKTTDPEAAEATLNLTTPYTLFSGAAGITSIVVTNGIYDYKKAADTKHVTSYLKINTGGSSKIDFTIATGYTAVLKMKMGGYSANPTITLKKGEDVVDATSGEPGGKKASIENDFNEITYELVAGTYTLTTATKTLYISHIDLQAEAIPAKTVTYHANNGTSDQIVDNAATQIADCSFSYADHKFIGWRDGSDNAYEVGDVVSADLELYAQWKEYFTITYKDGEATIGTEDVFTDAAPAGIANPVKMGNNFAGWVDGENNPVTIASLNAATTVYAKWTAFDGCVELWPETSGEAPTAADEEIVLQSGSKGGRIVTVSAKSGNFNESFGYTANGLGLMKGGDDVIGVTLNNEIAVGTKISVTLYSNNEGERGLILQTAAGEKVGSGVTLGWADATIGAVETFTYTAEAGDGLVGTNGFRLKRSNTVFLQTIKVTNCGDAIVYHNVTSAVDPAGKGTVTLGASSVREGYTTTATYSEIDPAYEFVNWTVSGAGASIADASANPATITMGTEDAVVTLNLQVKPVYYTVTYYDGTSEMGTEQVAENGHPSATGITTKKLGYNFLGWSETDGDAVVELNNISITTDKDLYAKYEAVVCPTTGTVYKFQLKTDLTSGNLAAGTDVDMSSYVTASGDGELLFTAASAGQGKIVGDTAIQFTNPAAYLKVNLACALAAGDQIRVRAYGNPVNIQVGASYDSSKDLQIVKQDFEFKDITSSMEGLQTLYITRASNGNATLTYFEIYRRPVATGATLADLTIRQGQSKTPVMTLLPSADARVTSQVWEIVGTPTNLTGAAIDPATGAITTGTLDDPTSTGSISVKVTLNGSIEATCTATVVGNIDQQDVTKSTVWDWHNTGATANIQLDNNTTDPKKNENFVLANVAVNNNDEFESDKLAVEGEHMVRDYNKTNPYFQGQLIQFHTTVAGVVRVKFAHTGDATAEKPARELYINGVATGDTRANATPAWSNYIEVPAGDVSITAHYVNLSPAATQQYIRVFEIEFFAENTARARTLAVGNLGTTCIENECIVRGAEIYAIKGKNEIGKIVFEELDADEVLEAGHPYVMVAKEANIRFFNTTEEPATSAGNDQGLIGTFAQQVFAAGEASNGLYFFKEHALWAAKETGMTIPAYRCYLNMNAVGTASPNPAPGRRRIVLGVQGEQVATGIDELNASEAPVKVMIDGQLFIIRGEKMYNANGQLVK